MHKTKPSKKFLTAAKIIPGLRQENKFLFIYKGHEINLSGSGEEVIDILLCMVEQLAEQATKYYTKKVEELFNETTKLESN